MSEHARGHGAHSAHEPDPRSDRGGGKAGSARIAKVGIWWAIAMAITASAPPAARAEPAPSCTVAIGRENVVRCAVAASLSAKGERLVLESLDGRRRTASTWLPSNPSLGLGIGYPIEPGLTDRPALWSASLSQELEIAGQRGARLDVVTAEQRAQRARLAVVQRDVAADALLLYYDALAATEETRIADRLGAVATAMTTVARARSQLGVSAGVESQLADAIAARLMQTAAVAKQRSVTTSAALTSALGMDPSAVAPPIHGVLEPPSVAEGPDLIALAITRRGEIAVAKAESEAQQRRASLYRRLRIPNPTIGLSARNDWVGERNVTVGMTLPIPLPSPVGRTYAGEIAEATALSERAEVDAERIRRTVRLEVSNAIQVVASRRRQLELYPPERVRETEAALRDIAQEVAAGRLPLKDAIVTQQILIDFLFANVEVRRQLCFATVELARAAGLLLEGGGT